MKYIILVLCFLTMFFISSCMKEDVAVPTFQDALIGKWELREAIDRINYRDEEWHNVKPPLIIMKFGIDSSFLHAWQCTDTFSFGTYIVSNEDSVITIYDPIWRKLKPKEFTNESFINEFMTQEGIVKYKYFKVE